MYNHTPRVQPRGVRISAIMEHLHHRLRGATCVLGYRPRRGAACALGPFDSILESTLPQASHEESMPTCPSRPYPYPPKRPERGGRACCPPPGFKRRKGKGFDCEIEKAKTKGPSFKAPEPSPKFQHRRPNPRAPVETCIRGFVSPHMRQSPFRGSSCIRGRLALRPRPC